MTLLPAILLLCLELFLRGHGRKGMLQRIAVLLVVLCIPVFLAGITTRGISALADAARVQFRASRHARSQRASRNPGTAPASGSASDEGGPVSPNRLELLSSYSINLRHTPRVHLALDRNTSSSADASGRLYLRTDAYEIYLNRRWEAGIAGHTVLADADDGVADGRIQLQQPRAEDIEYTVFLRYPAASLPHLLTAIAIDLPVVARWPNGTLARPVSVKGSFFMYRAASRLTEWQAVKPRPSNIPATDNPCARLPQGELMDRIGALARTVLGDEKGFAGTVEKLRAYLASEYEYSLEVENPEDFNPLENFLFHEKKGHCELFATGLALMLRSTGIPARLAVGYCGGEYDASKNLHTFFSDDAHAWVEILAGESGWVTVDPTPAESPLAPSPPRRLPLAIPFNPDKAVSLADIIAASPLVAGTPRADPTFLDHFDLMSIVAALVLLVVAVPTLLITSRCHASASSRRIFGSTSSPPGYLRLFLRHFEAAGHPKPPGRTLLEYINSLKQSGLIADEYDAMTAYTYRISYEAASRDPAFEKSISRMIRSA